MTGVKSEPRRFKYTEAEYRQLTNGYIGLCLACGEERDSCEPDAEGYECEACGESQVYGAEQLLVMGRIDIVEELGELTKED